MVFFFIFIFLYISLLLYIYSPSVFLILPATHVFPFSASHCWLHNIFLGSCFNFICFSFIFSWLVWYCAFFTDALVTEALDASSLPEIYFPFARRLYLVCVFSLSFCQVVIWSAFCYRYLLSFTSMPRMVFSVFR